MPCFKGISAPPHSLECAILAGLPLGAALWRHLAALPLTSYTDAQQRLNDRVAELQARTDIDAQTKQIMVQNLEEVENRRLSVLSTNINTEKDTRIQASRENMESQVRQIQTSIKTFAILLPPIPVIVLGVVIFARRQRREREGAVAARRLKE